jgi:hypothetical protein
MRNKQRPDVSSVRKTTSLELGAHQKKSSEMAYTLCTTMQKRRNPILCGHGLANGAKLTKP